MSASTVELIVAFVLGLATNFIAWATLFHLLVPKIRFSSSISKVRIKAIESDRSGFRYRFKIENAGRRNIIDIELTARLSVKGLRTPTIWNTLYLPLNEDGGLSYRIPMMMAARKGVAGRRKIIFLHPNSAERLRTWTIFPETIRERARDRTLLLEDLLKLGTDANLEIQAYCYDSFSGTRKLFVSPSYKLGDMVDGGFDPRSLDVIPHSREAGDEDSSEEMVDDETEA